MTKKARRDICQEITDQTIDKEHCYSHARELGEQNDCTVRALSVATQIDYPAMRYYLEEHGRQPGRGLLPAIYMQALKDLGYRLTALDGPRYLYQSTQVRPHRS